MSETEEKEVKGSIDLLQSLKTEKQPRKKEVKKIKRPIIIWWKPGEIPMGWACAIDLNPSGDLLTTNQLNWPKTLNELYQIKIQK